MKRQLDVTKDVTCITFNNLAIPTDDWFCVLDYLNIEDLHRLKTVSKILHRFTHLYARQLNLGIFAIYSGPSYDTVCDLKNDIKMTFESRLSSVLIERTDVNDGDEEKFRLYTKKIIVQNVCIFDFIPALRNIRTTTGPLLIIPLILGFQSETPTDDYNVHMKVVYSIKETCLFYITLKVPPECKEFTKLMLETINTFQRKIGIQNRQIICGVYFSLNANQEMIMCAKMKYGNILSTDEPIQHESKEVQVDEEECFCRLHDPKVHKNTLVL